MVSLALIFATRVARFLAAAAAVSWRKPTKRLTTRLLYLHHEFMISARQALSVASAAVTVNVGMYGMDGYTPGVPDTYLQSAMQSWFASRR